jgi:RHS repeat-associated protein
VDSTISRLSSISDSSATLEAYSYLGLDTVVKRAHPQPGVDLTYIKQTGESNGDAGDPYIGLDRFGRVVDQRWINTSTGTATDRFQYGYDRDGNVLYKNNLVNSASSELYHANGASNGYDNLNQLTAFARGTLSDTNSDGIPDTVASPSASEGWTYDAQGNMTTATGQSRTFNQQNELTAAGSNSLTYDAAGEMTKDEVGQTYTWDAWDEIVQVKNSGGTTIATYKYDALGRQTQMTESGTTTDVYYSDQWQDIEEEVGSTTTTQYVWGAQYVDELVERDRGSERLYAQQDANWNVTALLNTSGAAVERYLEDPYGVTTYLNGSWGSLSGSAYAWQVNHQGGRLDTVTGNYNFRNREYRPSIARWASNDPIRYNAGDSNLYRYIMNQPTSNTDPYGMDPPLRNNLKLRPGQSLPPSDKKPSLFKFSPSRPLDLNAKLLDDKIGAMKFELSTPTDPGGFDIVEPEPFEINPRNVTIDFERFSSLSSAEKANMPKNTVWIREEEKFRAFLTNHVKKYGLLTELTLTQHGGVGGTIFVAPGVSIDGNTRDAYAKALKEFGPDAGTTQILGKPLETIKFLKTVVARGATVRFVQCQTPGKESEKIRDDLTELFGPDVNVVLFDGGCGFRNGVPMKQTTALNAILESIWDWLSENGPALGHALRAVPP